MVPGLDRSYKKAFGSKALPNRKKKTYPIKKLLLHIAQSLILGPMHPKKLTSGVTEHGSKLPKHHNRTTTNQRSNDLTKYITMS